MENVTNEILKEIIKKELYKTMPKWVLAICLVALIIAIVLHYILKKHIDNKFEKEVLKYTRISNQILYKNQKRYDEEKKILSEINIKIYNSLNFIKNFSEYRGELTQDRKELFKTELREAEDMLKAYTDMFSENGIGISENIFTKYNEFREKMQETLSNLNAKIDDVMEIEIITPQFQNDLLFLEQMNKDIIAITRQYVDGILEDKK